MSDPQHILEHVFGYDSFRGPQQAIIEALVRGDDALVIMPTGGGKSLCYQIPSLAREGCGVVISPLIALMQDQVDALKELGVRAGFLNSSLSSAEASATEQALLSGELDLLYIAPERLVQSRCQSLLQQAKLSLFAIDEAHCVSQWGHDFRSDYLQLSLLHELFPTVPRIALTATADARTQKEIAERLQLTEAEHFLGGFDRPNIQYRIQHKDKPRQQLLQFLRTEHPQHAGIVYCLSRKKVEQTAEWLSKEGFTALPYHAGLPATLKQTHQRRFLREESVIIVATIAFGMGIDKPDVRFVVHLDLPKSVEAYYQETGRAGRDGDAATALLLYGLEDVVKLGQMLGNSDGNDVFKRHERQRLDAMLGLCEITSCRRQVLLRYFGEQSSPCGNCDNCISPAETWDGTDASRKLLSCIYRTGQRYGANHVIEVLRGSSNEKVMQAGHSAISTYGIGKELSNNEWRSVVRQLVAQGLIDVNADAFGALQLNDSCRALLRGEQTLQLRRDKQITASASPAKRVQSNIDEQDMPLWHDLRACRKRLADEHQVPPYVVFHDATLIEMVQKRPTTKQAMLTITGVGDSKLERFGKDFIDVILEHEYRQLEGTSL
ncbi:MAG: DNA helicase RecQ [Gammaproteobacteria bacterium]|nr:DNA helicase RecQ [Gammaproteobacteria bacterium]MBQ0773636.1 DNA helicase RecQ [Gammaproteobacteria bacterium]|tara:strand:- start:90977 stop:92797 length:1821 start_codon:yes stop_codon:yes gene_type:complete